MTRVLKWHEYKKKKKSNNYLPLTYLDTLQVKISNAINQNTIRRDFLIRGLERSNGFKNIDSVVKR